MDAGNDKIRECIAALILSPLYFSLPLIERRQLILATVGLM
jgi:hypothetical protein